MVHNVPFGQDHGEFPSCWESYLHCKLYLPPLSFLGLGLYQMALVSSESYDHWLALCSPLHYPVLMILQISTWTVTTWVARFFTPLQFLLSSFLSFHYVGLRKSIISFVILGPYLLNHVVLPFSAQGLWQCCPPWSSSAPDYSTCCPTASSSPLFFIFLQSVGSRRHF